MASKLILKHIEGDKGHRRFHKLAGIFLMLIGFFWFAKKVGWVPVEAGGSGIFWPVVVLVLGIAILIGSRFRQAGKRTKTSDD
jgi:hypothetical protein